MRLRNATRSFRRSRLRPRSNSARNAMTRCRCTSPTLHGFGKPLGAFPGISVPCGTSGTGLPIGVQFMAPKWREDTLLRPWVCDTGDEPVRLHIVSTNPYEIPHAAPRIVRGLEADDFCSLIHFVPAVFFFQNDERPPPLLHRNPCTQERRSFWLCLFSLFRMCFQFFPFFVKKAGVVITQGACRYWDASGRRVVLGAVVGHVHEIGAAQARWCRFPRNPAADVAVCQAGRTSTIALYDPGLS